MKRMKLMHITDIFSNEIFMCMCVDMCMWIHVEEGIGSLGAGVQGSCESLFVGTKLPSSERPKVFLTTEPSLQLQSSSYNIVLLGYTSEHWLFWNSQWRMSWV